MKATSVENYLSDGISDGEEEKFVKFVKDGEKFKKILYVKFNLTTILNTRFLNTILNENFI